MRITFSRSLQITCLLAVCSFGQYVAAQTVRQWAGITGNQQWNRFGSGGWNGSVPDNSSEIGRVTNGGTNLHIYSSTPSYTVNGVQILNGASSLSVWDGRTLTLTGTSSQIASGAELYIGIAPTFTSRITSGTVAGNAAPTTLTNNGAIQGTGTISAGFTNTGSGQILANRSGRVLTISNSGTQNNTSGGDLIATSGGTLRISAPINNTGGFITANSGSTVEYSGASISNGTINGTGIHSVTSSSIFAGVAGSAVLRADSTTTFQGDSTLGGLLIFSGATTLNGSSTSLTSTNVISVGGAAGATLNVESSSLVQAANDIVVGGATGNTGTVSVTNTFPIAARLSAGTDGTGDLVIGRFGTGSLDVHSNSRASAASSVVIGDLATGNGTVVVREAGAALHSGGDLSIGNGGTGALTVQAGGVVSNTDGFVGRNTGGDGTALVTGTSSQWNNSDSLYVGGNASGAGGTGTVNVTNGGALTVGDTLNIYSGSTVNVDAASTLSATNIVANGDLNWAGGALDVGAGQTLSGSGDFSGIDLVTIANGGMIAPGNSTGTLIGGAVAWGPGGMFDFEVNDFNGTAGSNTLGWDLLMADSIAISSTIGNPFGINLLSLTSGQVAGLADNFDGMMPYSLMFASTTGGITGFNSDLFSIDTSGFQNSFTGNWFVSQTGNDLLVNYATASAAVPEPSSFAILGLGAIGFAIVRRRKTQESQTVDA